MSVEEKTPLLQPGRRLSNVAPPPTARRMSAVDRPLCAPQDPSLQQSYSSISSFSSSTESNRDALSGLGSNANSEDKPDVQLHLVVFEQEDDKGKTT